MPVGALTSIGHRISGVVLAASVPLAVYLFGLSLRDARGFAQVVGVFGGFAFKAAALRAARRSAWLVNLAGLCVALLAAVLVW